MNKEPVLYIGVAGLLAEDTWKLSDFYQRLVANWNNNSRTPFLFLGLQTSRKFLNGEQVSSFYSSRMNTREQIIEAAKVNRASWLMSKVIVHYNPSGSYNKENVDAHVAFLISTDIKGIQWNGFSTNKSPETLPRFPNFLPRLITGNSHYRSILQIGKQDYENPNDFVVKIKDEAFQDKYTHFLIDGSGGRGIPINEEKAIRFILTVKESGNNANIALSGGFGPGMLSPFERIKKAVGDDVELSIDVEGNVRDEQGFSMSKAKAFLKEVINFYK